VEFYLIYLIVGFCILLIVGLFVIPIMHSSDYSNPIIAEVQYTEKEYITKTQKVISDKIPLGAFTLKTLDFSISQGQTVKVEWSSTKQVSLVAVMQQSTYDSFYKSMILSLGMAGATAVLTDGLSISLITSLVVPKLPDLLKHIGSVSYYALNSSGDIKTINLTAGSYKVVVFGVLMRAGSSMINITYNYQVLEDISKYRQETHYPIKRITLVRWLLTNNSGKPTQANKQT
jgi:hypothetical protein